ncbi:MAG: acyl-CoA-binding protein [Sphingobacteriales bacterium]|nr:MAG: acyl-CoA-binding protein [Sphingobacteriales bacterium]
MTIISFAEAVAESKKLPQKPDNETLLRLYSLYKQATEGNAPTETAFGMFDFVAKAKHEAWLRLKDLSRPEAEAQYIALVQTLSGN